MALIITLTGAIDRAKDDMLFQRGVEEGVFITKMQTMSVKQLSEQNV